MQEREVPNEGPGMEPPARAEIHMSIHCFILWGISTVEKIAIFFLSVFAGLKYLMCEE